MEYDRGITLNPPNAPTLSNNSATVGYLTHGDNYAYAITYLSVNGESMPSISASSVPSASNSMIITLPIGNSLVIGRRIYRTQGAGSTFTYVAQITDNTTTIYIDTASDASIAGNAAPPTASTASSTIAVNGIIKAKDTFAEPVSYNIVANNVGTQADSLLITTTYTNIIGVALGSSVILPEIREPGEIYWITETSGGSLLVYPPVGSEINALGTNNAYTLNNGLTAGFLAVSNTEYVTL